MKKILAATAALFMATGLFAQDWEQVKKLYQAGMYSESVRLVQDVNSPMAEGYRALCALQLRTDNAYNLANAFVEKYHEHILVPQVRFLLALDYFDHERYEDALAQFNKISQGDIQRSQQAEYVYKLGYCAFAQEEWDRAENLLVRMRNLPYSDYTAPAYYTLGYMQYARKDFKGASEWFEKAADDHRFSALANYYILECRFNEKDYRYVVKFGEDLFDKVPEDRQPHMARIMSESYLVLGDVDKARTYYEKNLRNKAKLNRSDLFYAGEINYLIENWEGAVENFNRMEDKTDSLGQVANYQLGYSYIKLHNKVAAMQAFKEASELSYTPDIQEDALFNYAKLAFDLGRDTAPFQEYLKQYDTRKKGDQIYSYMAMVALQNHDYEAAVDAYDHIDQLDPGMQSNYMKAYFLRARELMENGSWRSAVPHLKAAAYYSSRKDGFNQLAYTYFKEADYTNALKWFQNYLDGDARVMGADAQTRIADCYFFSGDYTTAVAAYERQMATYPDPENLYPRYRAGVACGLLEDNARKVHFLEDAKQASPQAPYYGESLYELGRAYVSLRDEDDAIRAFRTLRSSTSDPNLATKALLELGMIARNGGRSNEALDYYKQVVAQGGEYMEDALLAIEAIYRTREDPEAYLDYIDDLGDAAHRTDAQKEEVYFSSAEQIYMSGDYAKAQGTLLAYLQKYPQATFGAKARFYLADCYRFTDQREQAADLYQEALDAGLDGALAESALLQMAKLQYELGSYGKAYSAYLRLRDTAQLEANRGTALIGLMRSAFRARQWDDALEDALAVMNAEKENAELLREARYVRGKSFLSTSRREEALAEFQILAEAPSTNEGAEAAYLLIQDQYDRGQFDGIQDKVYAFAEKAGGQNYWLAKAFIVLGDSFAEQGNLAQAKATFESIKNGYTSEGPQDDVLDQVELRLRKLQ